MAGLSVQRIMEIGGLETGRSITKVRPGEAIDLLNMHHDYEGAITGRQGYEKYPTGGSAIGASDMMLGAFDFHKADDATQHEIVYSETGGAGAINKRNGNGWTSLKTGLATGRPSFGVMGNLLLVNGSNRTDAVQVFDDDEDDDHKIRDLGIVKPKKVLVGKGDFVDYTSQAASSDTGSYVVFSGLTSSQAFYFGVVSDGIPNWNGLRVEIANPNGNASVMTVKYPIEIDGGITWVDIGATDNTASGGATLAVSEKIAWNIPYNWAKTDVDGKEGYWVQITVSKTLDPTTDIERMMATMDLGMFSRRKNQKIKTWTTAEIAASFAQVGGVGNKAGDNLGVATTEETGQYDAVYVEISGTAGENNANTVTMSEINYYTDYGAFVGMSTVGLAFDDATEGSGATFNATAIVAFERPGDWGLRENGPEMPGQKAYVIHMKFSGAMDSNVRVEALEPLRACDFVVKDEIVFTDYTSEATDVDAGTHVAIGGLARATDKLYIGMDDLTQFAGIKFDMDGSVNSAATLASYEYYSESLQRWVAYQNLYDGTATGSPIDTAFAQDGSVLWETKLIDWIPTNVNGEMRYWIRIRPATADLSGAAPADIQIDRIDVVQSMVPTAKYQLIFQSHVMLFNVKVQHVVNSELVTKTYPSRLYWSDLGLQDDWETVNNWLNFDEAAEDLTGGSTYGQYGLFFTPSSTFLVSFHETEPVFTKRRVHSRIGCVSHWSIVETNKMVAWVSPQGFYALFQRGASAGAESLIPVFIGEPMDGFFHGSGNGIWAGLKKSRMGEIAAVHYPERKQIRWALSYTSSTEHDMEAVFEYDVTTEGQEFVWTRNTYAEAPQCYMLSSTTAGDYTLITGGTDGRLYKQDVADTYNDDGAAITKTAKLGWVDVESRYSDQYTIRPKVFRYGWFWGSQNVQFTANGAKPGTKVSFSFDHERTARTSTFIDFFKTGSIEKEKSIGIKKGHGRVIAVTFEHDEVDENFAIHQYHIGAHRKQLGLKRAA